MLHFIDWIQIGYGLTLFSMGTAIWVLPRTDRILTYSSHLGWLAAFGALHGLMAFVDVARLGRESMSTLLVARNLLLVFSFLALFEFARRLVQHFLPSRLFAPSVAYPVLVVVAASVLVLSGEPLASLDLGMRYVVGFPAALATGLLLLRYPAFSRRSDSRIGGAQRWVAGAFVAYAALLLFIDTPVDFAGWIPSTADFSAYVGLPVQLFQVAAAVIIALATLIAIRVVANRQTDASIAAGLNAATDQILVASERESSAAKLNEAQRIAKVGSWELDLLTDRLEWSDEIYRIFEIDNQDFGVSYEAFLNSIRPEDRALVDKAYSISLETGEPYEVTRRLKMPDGRIKYLRGKAETVFADNGDPLRSRGTVQDITESHFLQRELLKSEAQYRGLIERADELIFQLRVSDLTFDYMSPSFEKLLGVSAKLIAAHPVKILRTIHPDYRDFIRTQWTNILKGRLQPRIEYWIVDNNGRERWIVQSNSGVYDDDGRLTAIEGVCRDETTRKIVEVELERLATIVQYSSDFIGITDIEGNALFLNAAGRKLVGLQDERCRDSVVLDYFPEEVRDFVASEIIPILMSGGRWEGEINFQHFETGELIPVWFDIFCIKDPSTGRPINFGTVSRDMRGQKHSTMELERLVGSRTVALTAARNEAESANAAKSDFLSRMSHELRTPLNAILGFGQLLETDAAEPLTPVQSGSVHEMMLAGRQLLSLVNEVLDLSQVERGALMLSLEPTQVWPVFHASLRQLSTEAKKRDVLITYPQESNLTVLADRTRLQQVLMNLLSNSIKFNSVGGSVNVQFLVDASGHLRIEIRDTGIGIAAEEIPRLFQPFDRLGLANSGIEGTGIGLTLAKHLTEAMHGEIGVDSHAGIGTTFWLRLPMTEVQIRQDKEEVTAVRAETNFARSAEYSILYIEDNPANMEFVNRIVERLDGVVFYTAIDAESGLATAEREHPDLILLDLCLPDMYGYDVLAKLKGNARTSGIPVIAVTSEAMLGDFERGMEAGFADYITKPIDIAAFGEVIRSQLGNRADQDGA